MKIKVKKLHPDAVVPKYATEGASGFDLVAIEDVELYPGDTILIKTGLQFDVGPGYELQIRPRSGLSLKTKLRISNAPGTVDSDFRGEVCVIMTHSGQRCDAFGNGGSDSVIFINKGDRIAQGVIQAVEQAEIEEVKSLDETLRGNRGFGSTGR